MRALGTISMGAAVMAAGAGGWYLHSQMNVDAMLAASLAGTAVASLGALGAASLAGASLARLKRVHKRLERLETEHQAAIRAMASTPDRIEAAAAPLRRRLARAERAVVTMRQGEMAIPVASSDGANPVGDLNDQIAEAMQGGTRPPSTPPAAPEPSQDEALAKTVQGLVSRYAREGRPPLTPSGRANDDVVPAGRQRGVAASFDASSKVAEKLAASLLRQTLNGNGLQLDLTPVCRLPNRRAIWHEAVSQLRGGSGLLTPADYIPLAGAAGMMPEHDTHLIKRLAETMETLPQTARVFFNLHVTSLVDPGPLDELTRQIERTPSLASRIVVEFSQGDLHRMGPEELRGLNTLAKLGFEMSLDGVEDLRLDWKAMARQGFRFVKVPVHILSGEHRGADVHPADLAAFVERVGITLIAEDVDGEGRLLQIKDHDVAYAQGRLFADAPDRDPRFLEARDAA